MDKNEWIVLGLIFGYFVLPIILLLLIFLLPPLGMSSTITLLLVYLIFNQKKA